MRILFVVKSTNNNMANLNPIQLEYKDDVIDRVISSPAKKICGETVLTERIRGKGNIIICACCKAKLFPKRILFRTTKNNGMVLFNYTGKGGMGCFLQYSNYYFCKNCFTNYGNVLEEIVKKLRYS